MSTRLVKIVAGLGAVGAMAFSGVALATGGNSAAAPATAPAGKAAASAPAQAHTFMNTAATTDNDVLQDENGKDDAAESSQGTETAGDQDSPEQQESSAAPESGADAAAQAAACKTAGIDPNAGDVNFDDQTGVCSLDTGANNGAGDSVDNSATGQSAYASAASADD